MSEAVKAVDIIYLFRIQGEAGNAWKLGLQTDGSTSESRAYETTQTKDGSTKTPGAYEATHSITSYMVKGDPTIKKLRQLVRDDNPKKLEVWEINRSDINDTNTTEIDGEYSLDSVTSVSISAGAEGNVEVSIETEVNNTVVSGSVTVTPELLAILKTISEDQEFVQPTTKTT